MDKLNDLKKIIKKSELSSVEAKEMVNFFSHAGANDLAIIIEVFKQEPEWIVKIGNNIKAKKKILSSRNKKVWRKIIEKEKADLLKVEDKKSADIIKAEILNTE